LNYPRALRVAEAIKEDVCYIISMLKDPRVGIITVMGVKVSADLKNATVFISSLDCSKKEEILGILDNAKGYIRTELGKKLRLKYLPELSFKWDESVERGIKISRIIQSVKKAEDDKENNK